MGRETNVTLVVVTGSDRDDSSLERRLRGEGRYRVHSASTDSVADVLEGVVSDGIVLELERPDAIRNCLEQVREFSPAVPTIVAPPAGDEALAAAAVRGDATEYAPLADDGVIDRIETAVVADTADGDERDYHRIIANELPDEAFVIAADGTYLEAKARREAADLYGTSSTELTGNTLADAFPPETAERLQSCLERAIEAGETQSIEYEAETNEGTRYYEARVVPTDRRIAGRRAVVWLARDITERARRERELRSQRAELETLNRINTLGRRVVESLVGASERETIERDVCEQIVESELYCGSWIAELGPDGELVARSGTGEATTYLDQLRDLDCSVECPATEAALSGDVRTVTHVQDTEPLPEPLQEAAHEDDVDAVLAVPVSYDDSIYGVLTVLSERADAFSESEREAFELLGGMIGFTIMAIKNRELLLSDSVVELEFRIDGGDTFSFDLTERYDCRCSLEWTGTTNDGRTYQYVTVEGLEAETVLEEATDHDSIEGCRLIHDGTEQCTIEMRLCKSGVRTLTNHGVTIRDVRVEDGVGTCCVEVSRDADVREIAEALGGIYENTELVARRVVDRPVHTAAERRKRILDELTDRQLTTLRLAYYGGFFEWPRESTGEEIAESMDVSPPTMHQHLRKGLKTILGEFFEDGGA
ncbi:bacterio-opsin activator domain-containing protein [Halopiger goleimassiliensis]|uniref:bacterio-opsin activator domain-containing protein n=1 Tax=Halopiger goleimassiliensis TaxID=1293048 RepID=UPI0006778DA9|nr:bacterio-opsin activator domain-containing protein [Halopiger goleimassiliensis]